jgi:hypothetical protein
MQCLCISKDFEKEDYLEALSLFYYDYMFVGSCGSLGSIVSDYRLNSQGSIPGRGKGSFF